MREIRHPKGAAADQRSTAPLPPGTKRAPGLSAACARGIARGARFWLGAALWLALGFAPVQARAGAELRIVIRDGDPFDRILLTNTGSCAVIGGALVLDFTGSRGRIVIDTAYGGLGSKDPMPVAVESGDIGLPPVADGAKTMTILINSLSPQETASITLDFDNQRGFFGGPHRVSIKGGDVAGSRAEFSTPSFDASSNFGRDGAAMLSLTEAPCPKDVPKPDEFIGS